MSNEKKSAAEELNAIVKFYNGETGTDDFKKYQDILNKVCFDQSEFGIKNFGIGEQGTIHRKLRHCLLQYDGKVHALLDAQAGLKRASSRVKLQEIKMRKLTQEIQSKIDIRTGKALNDFDIETKEIEIEMCQDEIDKIKRELMQQQKLITDAQNQTNLFKEEIDRLLPLVEADGRTFEQAEADYWKYRFVRDVECEAKANSLGVDKGIIQSISQLPQSTQEEIVKEINKITLQLKGGGLPFEFGYHRLGEGKNTQMLAIGQSKVNDPSAPDIIIGCLKRTEKDICITDAENMLIIPGELNRRIDYVHGYPADTARNMIIQKAMEDGAKYVFFIDDDTLVPRNALCVLYDAMEKHKYKSDRIWGAIGGHYYKKTLPLQSACLVKDAESGKTVPVRPDQFEDNEIIVCNGILAAGCLLIDLEVCKLSGMTLPYFMELRAHDGDMLGTDDIHFTRKCLDYKLIPMLHLGVKCLHIDRIRNKVYGVRADEPYCCADVDIFSKKPTSQKKVVIGIPFREGDGPENMVTKFDEIKTPRGFAVEALMPKGPNIADNRNAIIKEALISGADYVFFLDDDVKIKPHYLVEMLNIMETSNVEILACPYPLKQDGYVEAILQSDGNGNVMPLNIWLSKTESDGKRIIEANWVITMGCTMIKTSALHEIREPWFFDSYRDNPEGILVTEDAYFTEKAIRSGFTPYIYLGMPCDHVDRKTGRIYSGSE